MSTHRDLRPHDRPRSARGFAARVDDVRLRDAAGTSAAELRARAGRRTRCSCFPASTSPPTSWSRPAGCSARSRWRTRCCRRSTPSIPRCSRSTPPGRAPTALPGRVGERHLAHRRVVHARPAARIAAPGRRDPTGRRRHRLRRPAGRLRRAQRAGARACVDGLDAEHDGRAEFAGFLRDLPDGGQWSGRRFTVLEPVATRWCGCTRRPAGGACSSTRPSRRASSGSRGPRATRSCALLHEVATTPERTYRHRWTAGDVVAWDNRATAPRRRARLRRRAPGAAPRDHRG